MHAQTTPQFGSAVIFAGDDSTTARRHTDLVIKDNFISFDTNGIRSEGGLTGTAALSAAANSYTYSNNLLYRAPSTAPTGYPTTSNWYETSSTPVGWADAANSDYSLSSGDYRAGQSRQASDGADVGADIATLTGKIGASSNAYGTATISAVSGAWSQTPFQGSPFVVPGTIPASDFDTGGELVSYHDNTAGCDGDCSYRSTDVDLWGSNIVRRLSSGEWTEYTVNVGSSGTYKLTAQVASDTGGATFHVEFDGVDVTGPLTFPNTGSWATFQAVVKTGISLSAGQKVMRVVIDSSNSPASIDLGSISSIKLEP